MNFTFRTSSNEHLKSMFGAEITKDIANYRLINVILRSMAFHLIGYLTLVCMAHDTVLDFASFEKAVS